MSTVIVCQHALLQSNYSIDKAILRIGATGISQHVSVDMEVIDIIQHIFRQKL